MVFQQPIYDLVVVGGTTAGVSFARQAHESGVERVLLAEESQRVTVPHCDGALPFEVHKSTPVSAVTRGPDHLVIEGPELSYHARTCVVASGIQGTPNAPDHPIPQTLLGRIHHSVGDWAASDLDVVLVGSGERVVEYCQQLVARGARVVVCVPWPTAGSISSASFTLLLEMEAERSVTVMWQTKPDAVVDVDGSPMVSFGDHRTPEIRCDHLVYALGHTHDEDPLSHLGIGLSSHEDASSRDCVYLLADPADRFQTLSPYVVPVDPAAAWSVIGATYFPELGGRGGYDGPVSDDYLERLRSRHYNATITKLIRSDGGHTMLRVRPDTGNVRFRAGDFASLGVGMWEPRDDDVEDVESHEELQRMIRTTHAISSPVFDDRGYLTDPTSASEFEFYMAADDSTKDRKSSLTPRLALFKEGDRIYVGPGVSGRYSLDPVTDPFSAVLFLSTGAGEAPHIAAIVELLRRGHQGPITAIMSAATEDDLLYLERLRVLARRYSNMSVMALLGENSAADLIDRFASTSRDAGTGLTHVFVCCDPTRGASHFMLDGDQASAIVDNGAAVLAIDLRDVVAELNSAVA